MKINNEPKYQYFLLSCKVCLDPCDGCKETRIIYDTWCKKWECHEVNHTLRYLEIIGLPVAIGLGVAALVLATYFGVRRWKRSHQVLINSEDMVELQV